MRAYTAAAALALALALAGSSVHAMPGMAGGAADDKAIMDAAVKAFQKADVNGDEKLTKEEFLKAFPGMKEAAFNAIDTAHDGSISRQEWQAFAIDHSLGRRTQGSAMPMGGMPPAGDQGLPPVTAPGGSGLPAVTAPGGSALPPVTAPEGR